MITLSQKDVQELTKFIDDLPFKYGFLLYNFLAKKMEESKTQQETIIQEEINN